MIKALEIFLAYTTDCYAPFHCEHDILRVHVDVQPDDMTALDVKRLDEPGFEWDDDLECWYSYRFGSC